MTKLEQAKLFLDFYFAPWGAAKGEVWELVSGDRPFDADTVTFLLKSVLAGNTVFNKEAVKCMKIITGG
jgi:hypothetical protein